LTNNQHDVDRLFKTKLISLLDTRFSDALCQGIFSSAFVFPVNAEPVIFHWKYKLDEISKEEAIERDTAS